MTSIRMSFSFSRMIPAPAPVGPEAPSTKIVHLSAPSFEEAGSVISATKSAKTCALRAFMLS
ncbi:hypothetical protein A2U01_0085960 [Trifolium medium]|uniref:Uncharacterized protein n=1 Tax=Trifolium medium TaxID=97028 RepID=A0A392TUF3_9FABA|nr:hypothetical protein [Trifolium medium]